MASLIREDFATARHRAIKVQHPTPNIEHGAIGSPHRELDVGCSMLDVLLLFVSGCDESRLLPEVRGSTSSPPRADSRLERGQPCPRVPGSRSSARGQDCPRSYFAIS